MKVLLVSHSTALYGAQRSLVDLAIGLRTLGIDVVVSVPEPGPLMALLCSSGFDVRLLPCRNWVHSRSAYHWFRKYLITITHARLASKWVRNEGFSLVHTNSVVTPIGALIARRVGLPHIWHVREGMPPKKDFFYQPFEKVSQFIVATTRFMIGISKHSCEGMKVICPVDRIRLVYNGPISEADFSDQSYRREGICRPMRVLCVGRVSKAKGHDVAAKALSLLNKNRVESTLTIAGDVSDEFRRELLEIFPQGIDFLGFVEDTSNLYRSHDILIMASKSEAFGRVTVEAMASGCMVVGTNSGGTPELVTHGETGMLFEPGSAEGLADQIEAVSKDHALVRRLRDNAHREAFARFTRERYAREVAELYREAVASA